MTQFPPTSNPVLLTLEQQKDELFEILFVYFHDELHSDPFRLELERVCEMAVVTADMYYPDLLDSVRLQYTADAVWDIGDCGLERPWKILDILDGLDLAILQLNMEEFPSEDTETLEECLAEDAKKGAPEEPEGAPMIENFNHLTAPKLSKKRQIIYAILTWLGRKLYALNKTISSANDKVDRYASKYWQEPA